MTLYSVLIAVASVLLAARPMPVVMPHAPASAGRLSIVVSFDGPFDWTFDDSGRMRVTAPRVPGCSLMIQARRGRPSATVVGFVIADFRQDIRPAMDISVMPYPGESMREGDYPVILVESCSP